MGDDLPGLSGSVVIVTGGTAGIGLAIVQAFVGHGARVVFTGRDLAKGAAAQQRLRDGGGEALFVPCDMADRAAPALLVDRVTAEFGELDVLVNNAGIVARGTVLDCDNDAWDRVLDINLSAPLRMMRAAIPAMQARKRGAIVNVASDWALVAASRAVAYATSKAALVHMTRCAALDHARDGIRINAICPGDTDTAMLDASTKVHDRAAMLAACGAAIPLGRVANPAEIARATVFLASAAASFITGIALPVDGGASLGPDANSLGVRDPEMP